MTIHASPAACPAASCVRPARAEDCAAIVGLIGELAAFEHLEHLMRVSPQALQQHLFGPQPAAECLVVDAAGEGAERTEGPEGQEGQEGAGALVAFALFFTNFSTFLGQPGLYLEDLYVQPAHRGRGLGKALLQHLARLANQRGCGRFEWSVLDWNSDAIGFYERMGAAVMPDWRICRLTGDALTRFGR